MDCLPGRTDCHWVDCPPRVVHPLWLVSLRGKIKTVCAENRLSLRAHCDGGGGGTSRSGSTAPKVRHVQPSGLNLKDWNNACYILVVHGVEIPVDFESRQSFTAESVRCSVQNLQMTSPFRGSHPRRSFLMAQVLANCSSSCDSSREYVCERGTLVERKCSVFS